MPGLVLILCRNESSGCLVCLQFRSCSQMSPCPNNLYKVLDSGICFAVFGVPVSSFGLCLKVLSSWGLFFHCEKLAVPLMLRVALVAPFDLSLLFIGWLELSDPLSRRLSYWKLLWLPYNQVPLKVRLLHPPWTLHLGCRLLTLWLSLMPMEF